jgi:[histone H3]-trimethyl-L-lysine4 demethylase
VSEGERIPWNLPQLPALKRFVERCNEWVEEATNYITRKQQNRRKNEKAWRKGNAAKAAEMEERDREMRKLDNITKLLDSADVIGFECPEILELRKRADAISDFQHNARIALANFSIRTPQELEDLVEVGKSFNVDMPEIDRLDKVVQQVRWYEQAQERRTRFQTLHDVTEFTQRGAALGITDSEENMLYFREKKRQGELWEAKAKELMSVETVHFQQLDALFKQAATLPVSSETLAAVDAILKKQREAQEQILSFYEMSKHPDFRQRPKYTDVRDAMEALDELSSKPPGTLDLEKELKRHQDWMRRGKKLFGKANAPLHILLSHMQAVEARNEACFDLKDQPRMPVEPSSREHTPGEGMHEVDGSGSGRDVFCICRKPEAGMMIECELCHEWLVAPAYKYWEQ